MNFKGMFLSYGSLDREDVYKITWAGEGKMFTPKEGASFEGMFEMVQIQELDLSQLDINKASNLSYMFEGYGQRIALSKEILQPFPGKIIWPKYEDESGNPLPIKPAFSTLDGQEGANMSYMFLNYRMCGEQQNNLLDLSNWDTSNVRNFQGMFSGFNGYKLLGGGCYGNNVKFPKDGLKTGAQANISYMFQNSKVYTNLIAISEGQEGYTDFVYQDPVIKLSEYIKTENVVNFSHVFDGAYSELNTEYSDGGRHWYHSVTIDISDISYSVATDMSYMFANAFTKTDFVNAPGSATELTGRLVLFDKSETNDDVKTINGEHYFDGCNVNCIDLGSDESIFDTSIFNNLSYFFANYGYRDCLGKIKGLGIFDMSNATSIAGLFYNSYFTTEDDKPLELDWSSDAIAENISKVTDMSYMFYGFKPKKLDIHT